ncbi:histidine phosphatase family protein [Peptostreptococcus equinus]|uniref:Histidine phosphatase family protein n=1 Tax=Peptostreptococcus equinus TaxID=3003601 RepID=A0ABY7JNY2_9FIRM|nr:histidine phosphatase family protein [Peptostreptococcus sp. CBA3647]WAW15088.1 histidine phosphatase family protein [Peptostreptococcus sp. CBA3647]
MKKLFIVRHAHTTDNQEKRFSGLSDCVLSDVGIQQAQALKEYLKKLNIDRIYTSTLKRTVQTIEEFACEENLEINKLDGLKEMDFGDFDMLTFQEVSEKFPDEIEMLFSGDSTYTFPNGECLNDMFERNVIALENILVECDEVDNVLLCIHMGTIRNLISYLLTKNNELHWSFSIQNAAVSCFEFYDGFPILSKMGHIPYDESLIRSLYNEQD